MSRPSTIAARCAALGTSVAQVIPNISSFARQVRDSRHDLNAINHDLLVIRTGLGIAQDDFSQSTLNLPAPLLDALVQILDSCDDTSERLHKGFLKLSCSEDVNKDWQAFKVGPLINLRLDLDASKIVMDLALDYIAQFCRKDTLDSILKHYVANLATSSDELLKRTDIEEIHVNQTARDRLPSLLKAIRLLRSCIAVMSREATPTTSQPTRRTTTPRPDSLDPSLGENRRSGRKSPIEQASGSSTTSRGIGTWLADVPSFAETPPLESPTTLKVVEKSILRPQSRYGATLSRGTFYTDDASSGRTLIAPESRLRKSRSWCTDRSGQSSNYPVAERTNASKYLSIMTTSDVSVFHRRITSDKIAVATGHRKELEADQRAAVDRILTNIPAEATGAEVERVLWEGANPMVTHPDFGYFFIRAAYEMSPDVLDALIQFGADITCTAPAPNMYGSAIHAATLGRQLATVKRLVALGHPIDTPNSLGETALHLAVKTPGAYEVARYLVGLGADVNHETGDEQTPLQATIKATMLEGKERGQLIELLLAHGAEGEVPRDMENRGGNSKGRSVLGL